MNKSICIATYNGSKYILKQIESIRSQLSENDEIIIVDDCSTDDTLSILNKIDDIRIKIFKNPKNTGHVKSFGRAISLAANELIFLSDQDDIWMDNRLNIFEDKFLQNSQLMLVTSKFNCIDENDNLIENSLKKISESNSNHYTKNICMIMLGNIGYYGCTMAFRRELVSKILPIPEYVEAHDLWIAMAGNLLKSNLHIKDKTLYHRIHQNNTSNLNRKLYKKIQARIGLYKQYMELSKRIRQFQ